MADFFAELKRRHIYRVAAAYAVVAWVLLQLVNNVAPVLDLPIWVARAFLLLLVIGFPITLLIAWMRELTPADSMATRAASGRLDWALMGALIVVIGLVSYQQLAPATGARTAQQAGIASNSSQPGGISVAVLPFANLSGDASQEFFSDGMTEEITTALTKVSALRVVGRESAFQFKGQKTDMRAIGQALGALYLIEGTVRKAGERVRISAQLTRADSGVNLWAENYDRELKDIFATQSDVAQAIAGALRVPLGLQQGETLVRNRTKDLESYDQYLRAKALVRARGPKPVTDAANLLEQVVARDPNFAPAWALLAQAYALTPQYYLLGARSDAPIEEARRVVDASLPKADAAARRAIQLDPNDADGYSSLALAQSYGGKLLSAEDLFKQALALDPNNPDTLHQYGNLLAGVGRLKEALAMKQRLRVLEPFVPIYNSNTAAILWLNGQNDAAIVMLKALPPGLTRGNLAEIYASMGRYSEAADALLEINRDGFPPGTVEAAARLLRTAPAPTVSQQTLPLVGVLGFVYLHVGAADRMLDYYEHNFEAGYSLPIGTALFWHPVRAAVRKTERFKAYLRANGYVDYWRAKGWPDLCRPMGADDFACE